MEKKSKSIAHLKKPIPGNDPVHVVNTQVSPYYFVGLLEMTFPNDEEYYGTATLVASDKNVEETPFVLTCAHNLYDTRDGGEVKAVSFTRGFNDPNKPYETINAVDWFYPQGYPDVAISKHADLKLLGEKLILANIDLDYALVKLEKAVSVKDLPLMVVEGSSELENLSVQINGYGIFEEEMSHATGEITVVEPNYLRYPITTDQGASGSAIMKNDNRSIVGIHTRSVPDEHLNQGVRITQDVRQEILGWMA